MIYEKYVNTSYDFADMDYLGSSAYHVVALYSDGTNSEIYSGSSALSGDNNLFVNLCGYVWGDYVRNYVGNAELTGFLYLAQDVSYTQLVLTNSFDFAFINNVSSQHSFNVCTVRLAYADRADLDIRDLSLASYYSPNSYGTFNTSSSYDYFDKTFNKSNSTLVDFSMVSHDAIPYYHNTYGVNVTDNEGKIVNKEFYRSVISINATYLDGVSFSIGRCYQDLYNEGYRDGVAVSYQTGYNDGFDDGRELGGVSEESATAFTYINGAFSIIDSITSLEVLPHVTIGMCFAIPVILVLIMTIFKIVKK